MNEDKSETFYGIGRMFACGHTLAEFEQNDAAAIKFYTKSAELGYAPAQYALAQMLLNAKKPEESFKWFLAAAKLGVYKSMYEVSSMYGAGIGCEVNEDACESWFVKAGGLPNE